MNWDESELTITALMHDVKIGHLNVVNDDSFIWASSVLVYDEYRRQGIATAMYLLAQQLLKRPFKPSEEQTEDAKKLWNYLFDTLEVVF